MEKGLLEKTGKPLGEWIDIVRKQNLEKYSLILNYLKNDHGLSHGFANFIALKSRKSDAGSKNADDLVTLQYAKGKEHFKPVYDKLTGFVKTLGDDVEIVPKNANVSVRAKRQFLLIQPSTKTRMDLGLKFNDRPIGDRLKGSGSFGAMCTHSVSLGSIEEIDEELLVWIKEAYQESK